MHLQENTLFDLDLGVKVTQNVAQFPLHHTTYSATKFEVATSNCLGGDTFTRNVTDAHTHRCTDRPMTDRLWYKIDIPFFSKEKSVYNDTGTRILDTIYHMTLKLLKNHIFGSKTQYFAIFYSTLKWMSLNCGYFSYPSV